jgi:hypothetical protein
MTTPRTGRCLCGAVRLTARAVGRDITACQCGQCRRWTGGGPHYTVCVDAPVFTGTEHIGAHHESAHGERAFCMRCGTHLYWRFRDGPVKHVAVGLLDDQEGLALTEEIFCDRRAGWMLQAPGATQSPEAEQLAMLARHLEGETP